MLGELKIINGLTKTVDILRIVGRATRIVISLFAYQNLEK